MPDGLVGVANDGTRFIDPDCPLGGFGHPEQRLHEFAAPGTDKTVKTQDLACTHLAVPEDRIAVRNAEDLIELVTDEEDRLAFGLQAFHQLVGFLDFLVGERGGRLIHDQNRRFLK